MATIAPSTTKPHCTMNTRCDCLSRIVTSTRQVRYQPYTADQTKSEADKDVSSLLPFPLDPLQTDSAASDNSSTHHEVELRKLQMRAISSSRTRTRAFAR